jgi:hypothetical protein
MSEAICIFGNLATAKEIVEVRYNERIRKIEVYSITHKQRYYPSNHPCALQVCFTAKHTLENALLFARHWAIAEADRAVIIEKTYLGGHPLPKGANVI